MTWAFGEVEYLVRKAVSGAGKPWGLAEEAGWAVRWLAERGLPGPEAIAECLDIPQTLCPIDAGTAAADGGTLRPPCELQPVNAPLLMLPFLARLCPENTALELQAGDAMLTLSRTEVTVSGDMPSMGAIRVQGMTGGLNPVERFRRVESIVPETLARLETFAARTYAPATEHSRNTGAGAGLVDND